MQTYSPVDLLARDRPWRDYPEGTKAHSYSGGVWLKLTGGQWQFTGGSKSKSPGPDAKRYCIELPVAAASSFNLTTMAAKIGSCTCFTNSPEPSVHYTSCPFRKLHTAQENFESLFLQIPDVDETLLNKDAAGNYFDSKTGLMYLSFCWGVKYF